MPPTHPSASSSSGQEVWSASDLAKNPHLAADKADRVRTMFDGIAASYDLNNRIHSFGRDQAWRRAAVRMCAVRPDDRVLDVACGTGDLTEAFCQAGPADVVGLDFAEAMLDRARAKSARSRRADSLPAPTYMQGDAMNLPFEAHRFDIVSIAFGLRNVSDPQAALREFERVLRPGGRLVVLEFSEPRLAPVRWISNLYTQHIMPLTATLLARDRTGAYRYLPRSVSMFATPAELRRMFEAAGFLRCRQKRLSFGVCTATLGFSADD